MRTYRTFVVGVAVVAAVGMSSPASMARVRRGGAVSGTWTYSDYTPDPTTLPNDATAHCTGNVPAGPMDVNSQELVAKKTGTLTLTAHNQLDWAMEIHDSAGNTITGTDGADSTTPENMTIRLAKGTYEVIYCNFSGEPEITVDYSFK